MRLLKLGLWFATKKNLIISRKISSNFREIFNQGKLYSETPDLSQCKNICNLLHATKIQLWCCPACNISAIKDQIGKANAKRLNETSSTLASDGAMTRACPLLYINIVFFHCFQHFEQVYNKTW